MVTLIAVLPLCGTFVLLERLKSRPSRTLEVLKRDPALTEALQAYDAGDRTDPAVVAFFERAKLRDLADISDC
jgi:hypothetical protein